MSFHPFRSSARGYPEGPVRKRITAQGLSVRRFPLTATGARRRPRPLAPTPAVRRVGPSGPLRCPRPSRRQPFPSPRTRYPPGRGCQPGCFAVLIHNRKSSHLVSCHQRECFREVIVRVDADRILARQLADRHALGVLALRYCSDDEVAIRHHPRQLLTLENGQRADVVGFHQPRGFGCLHSVRSVVCGTLGVPGMCSEQNRATQVFPSRAVAPLGRPHGVQAAPPAQERALESKPRLTPHRSRASRLARLGTAKRGNGRT